MTKDRSESIRIALIGAGMYGEFHVKVLRLLENAGLARLVAFAAKTESTVKRQQIAFGVPGYTDYRKLMDDHKLDAVHVVTPDHLHREITVEAASRGLHVLVEKPMDMTVVGCRQMIKAAEQAGVLLQVDFHKRFGTDVHRTRELRTDGKLGSIQYGYLWMETSIDLPVNKFRKWAHHSSPAWIVGIHLYDLGCWLLDAEPKSVYATGQKEKLKSMGIDAYDSIQSLVKLVSGASLSFNVNWITPLEFESPVNQGVRIIGTEGFAEVDLQDRGAVFCTSGQRMSRPNESFYSEIKGAGGRTRPSGYGYESIRSFVENVRFLKTERGLADLKGCYPSGEDGLRATRIALASHRSIELGRAVQMEKEVH